MHSRDLDRRTLALYGLGLSAISIALYAQALGYSFVNYDDVRILFNHPRLYDERSFLASVHEIFVGYFPREEPLLVRDLSWAIDARLFGFRSTFGYHLGNLLLAAANAPLVFAFMIAATNRRDVAAAVGVAFAVTPVHVEPTCWIMGRKDLLCAFFGLLALVCEAAAYRAPARARLLRTAAFFAYVLAALSKTAGVTLVLVLAALRFFADDLAGRPPRRLATAARELASLWPHALAGLAIYAWYGHDVRAFGVVDATSDTGAQRLGDLARLLPLAVGSYVPSALGVGEPSILYQWPDVALPRTVGDALTAVAVVAALVAFFAYTVRRRRDLCFYGVAFFALMLPYLHVVSVVRWRADRYVYLASFCLFAILATGAADLIRARPALGRVVVGAGVTWALCAAFIVVTSAPRFRDDRALWTYEVGLREPAVHAYAALAASLTGEAATAQDATRRLALAAEAERVAQAGKVYYESIAWREGAPKRVYADLQAQLGLVSALRGEPASAQLALYEASYRIHQTETNLTFLAQTLYRIASEQGDLAMARRSLTIYGALVRHRAADAAQRPVMRRVLESYRKTFPSLAPEIDALERSP